MARKQLTGSKGLTAPRIARLVLCAIAPAECRECIIGDLNEEFAARFDRSGVTASAWYWREVARSIPGMLAMRSRSPRLRAAAITSAITAMSFVCLFLWDLLVAKQVAAAWSGTDGARLMSVTHLILLEIGVVLIGCVVAHLTFEDHRSFANNFAARLLPLMAFLTLPAALTSLLAQSDYALSHRIPWLLSTIICLLVGALAGRTLRLRMA